jgi:3-oxoadipate enol-lactonase
MPDPQTRDWARAQMHRTSLATALSASHAVSDFTSHEWAADIDVPTAVIVPTRDQVVHPRRQHKLAAAIPGAAVYEFDGDHGAFLNDPETLARILLAACGWASAKKPLGEAAPCGLGPGGQSGTRPVAT